VHVRFGERAWETDSGDTARRPCPTQPEVKLWGLWPIHVFVAIDHYSRKVVSVTPLEGPNSGWIIDTLEMAFEKYGSPKHIISDQDCVFTGAPFKDLLKKWNVKPRLGAVGKHGSMDHTSYYTSFVHSGMNSENRRRSTNLRPLAEPWLLTGASGPGGSYRHSFLPLYG